MRYLWNLVDRIFGKKNKVGIFLGLNILCFTMGTFAVGMLFCVVAGQLTVLRCMANVMCMAAYAGIIFGLFGGILFVMRTEE